MNYIKQNHLSLLIILWLVVSPFFSSSPSITAGGAGTADDTYLTSDVHIGTAGGKTGTFTVDSLATATFTGTTTITKSPDGFVLWDDFTVSTTSPANAALTNTGAPLICNGDSLAVYADSSGAALLAPSFKFVVGTTTSASLYADNLMASTTVATSTDAVVGTPSWNFLLGNQESITLSVGDFNSTNSSSTYYGNWAGQVSVHCRTIGS